MKKTLTSKRNQRVLKKGKEYPTREEFMMKKN